MYVALGMHPNIAFSVSFMLQFMKNPRRPHGKLLKVFRYLRGMWDQLTGNWQQQTPQMDWRKPGWPPGSL